MYNNRKLPKKKPKKRKPKAPSITKHMKKPNFFEETNTNIQTQ
jgi:hypothetical protein